MEFTCDLCGKTYVFNKEHFFVTSEPIKICNKCAEVIWSAYMEVIRHIRESRGAMRETVEERLNELSFSEADKTFMKKILDAFCTEDYEDIHSSEIRGFIETLFFDEDEPDEALLKQWLDSGSFSEEECKYFSAWLESDDPNVLEIMSIIDGYSLSTEGYEMEYGVFEEGDANQEEQSVGDGNNEVVENVKTRNINIAEIISEVLKVIKCQDYGVVQIGRLIYRHLLRLVYNNANPEDKIHDKQNFIVIGPTGVGKTATIREYCKLLGLPCVEMDMTGITKAGYIGENITDSFAQLVSMADGDINLAQRGIMILDEGDKNAGGSDGDGKDPGGRAVMIEMLKKLEGTDVPIGKGKTINTTDILFICIGTFEGAYEQRRNRLEGKKRMGFGGSQTDKEIPIKRFLTEDLVKGGAPAEWVGRFPCIVEFNKLTAPEYIKILRESSRSVLLQNQKLLKFGYGGLELIMTPEGEQKIAELAVKYDVGVRGLNRIMAEFLEDVEGKLITSEGVYSKVVIGETVTYE